MAVMALRKWRARAMIVSSITACALALTMLTAPLVGTLFAQQWYDVSVEDAKHLMETDDGVVVVDVRTQEEYDSGHIACARLIPLAELEFRTGELDRDRPVLVYCRSGGRSAEASAMIVENGIEPVYNMLGGITAGVEAGFPVTTEVVIPGDADADGLVDVRDVIRCKKIVLGLETGTCGADANDDGVIDGRDVIGIVKTVLGSR
jgi:rhodanese-related sulfurtransferase